MEKSKVSSETKPFVEQPSRLTAFTVSAGNIYIYTYRIYIDTFNQKNRIKLKYLSEL